MLSNRKYYFMQRNFIIGDRWLYYKIYAGPNTCDMLLINAIGPICKHLVASNLIAKWFFIRYSDPENHIRLRFLLNEQSKIGRIIESLFRIFNPYIETGYIFKIQTDTYKREIERYGIDTIEHSETMFYYDSIMVAEILGILSDDKEEDILWLCSMKAIDKLLQDFNYSMKQKCDLLEQIASNFEKEFNVNYHLIKQLSGKYRLKRKKICEFMNSTNYSNNAYISLIECMKKKSESTQFVVSKFSELSKNKDLPVISKSHIISFIHMFMNRLFQSKQRLHEMVIYGFLFRFYKSEIAKEKKKKQSWSIHS